MNRLKLITMMLLIGLFIGQLAAQNDTVYKFTLQQAQEFAIENYFVSKNAKLDIESADKKIWETTAMGLPQLSGGIDYTYMPVIPEINFGGMPFVYSTLTDDNQVITSGDLNNPEIVGIGYQAGEPIKMGVTNNISYNVVLSQLIFSGEYIVGLQASRVYKGFAQESYDKVKIDIRESVSSNYYALLILQKNKRVLSETLENLKINLSQTQKYFEQGLVEDTDVDQLDITVKRTENSLRMIENQMEYLERMFKYQIGLAASNSMELVDSIEYLVDVNIISPTAYEFNLEENIDYKMISTQRDLMELSYKRQKSTFLPTVSGFYQYKDQFNTPDFNTNIKHIVGVSMAIPIVSSGMRISQTGQARIELDKVENMRVQEADRLILTAQQSLFDYNTALQNYYNEQENFNLSERVFNKATVRFREGIMSSLDLSIINNQYLQAQLSYATAIQELLTKKVALDKSYNKL